MVAILISGCVANAATYNVGSLAAAPGEQSTMPSTTERTMLAFGLLFASFNACTLLGQQPSTETLLREAEPRFRAIYERREFRPKGFRAEWLEDSSGYLVQEADPDSQQRIQVAYDVRTGEKLELSEARGSSRRDRFLSPDGRMRIAFGSGDLFVLDLASQERTRLTDRDGKDISFRNVRWSPDSQRILFIEADSSDVRQRNMLVPDDPSYPSVRQTRFARVGETLTALRVGVLNVETRDLKWLPIEYPEEGCYLGHVDWANSSEEVLVEKRSRFRDQREFLLVSLDGNVTTLFEETNESWAVGSHGINTFVDWIESDGEAEDAFVFISEQDGWRHAYRCSRSGEKLTLLTPGEYELIDSAAVDEAGGWYYFYASPENATQKYLHRVPLDGSGEMERVTPTEQEGTHQYDFSPDRRWAFHTYSTIDNPPITELVELKGHRVVLSLEDNQQLRGKMQSVIARPTEFIELDIGEGVKLDAWMIKPKDFDATRQYPVFVYVYGEPYAQTVLDRWGAVQIDFHRVIADLGYLVVSIDNRGTPAPKGAAWRRSIFGSLGPLSTKEQAQALKTLARTRPYVDLSRVGIWGWSGGGSNTLNAMCREPELYDVGIAVVPKPQPHLYNAWFQEIYMRTREVNAEGYQRAAPINFAEGLDGKLLIITGSGETNTHIQIIEGLVDRLIELGKQFDYMVYPNRDHGLREGPGSEVHVRMLITRYLLENLPPGPAE